MITFGTSQDLRISGIKRKAYSHSWSLLQALIDALQLVGQQIRRLLLALALLASADGGAVCYASASMLHCRISRS